MDMQTQTAKEPAAAHLGAIVETRQIYIRTFSHLIIGKLPLDQKYSHLRTSDLLNENYCIEGPRSQDTLDTTIELWGATRIHPLSCDIRRVHDRYTVKKSEIVLAYDKMKDVGDNELRDHMHQTQGEMLTHELVLVDMDCFQLKFMGQAYHEEWKSKRPFFPMANVLVFNTNECAEYRTHLDFVAINKQFAKYEPEIIDFPV